MAKEPIQGIEVAREAMELRPVFAGAMQNPGPMGFSYEVGKIVAERVGRPMDAFVILVGAKMFISTFGDAKKILAT